MTLSEDYPRWMFHRGKEPVIVQNEEEETALGAGWSRRVTFDDPDAEEPEEDGDEEAPESEEEPAELPASEDAAPARKRAPRAAAGRRKRG